MVKYIITRIIFMFFILLFIISVLFITTRVAMLNTYSLPHPISEDIPIALSEYTGFIKGIFTKWYWGDTGGIVKVHVWDILVDKAPLTLKINLIAFLIYIPIGLLLGLFSAIYKDKWFDHLVSFPTLIFSSIPSFIMIFLLMILFGYTLFWVPTVYPPSDTPELYQAKALILPIIALSLGPIADLARSLRGELIETLDSDYILLVRTKGFTRFQAIIRHGLKNSMVPIVPKIIMTYITVLMGSFFIELIYNIPGVAREFLKALFVPANGGSAVSINTPLLVMIAAFYSGISLFGALLIDISYGLIDPRIKIGSKK